jgi:murein DD-endopeptidase MepM/ murein hydrolase activator NlpD
MKGFNDLPWLRNMQKSITRFIRPTEQVDKNSEVASTDYLQSKQGESRNKSKRWLSITSTGIVITVVLVFTGNQYVNANKITYYNVYVDDEEIGSIDDPIQIEQLFSQKRQEYQNKYPDVDLVIDTEGITTTPEEAFKAEVDSEATLKKLDGKLSADAKGVELKIEGKVVAIVKDQETVDELLNQIKQQYLPAKVKKQLQIKKMSSSIPASTVSTAKAPESSVKSVNIVEKVVTTPINTQPDQVLSAEKVMALLTKSKEAPIIYTVTEGDTLSSIALKYEISEKQIQLNNPEIEEKYLQIGDTLKLTVPKLPLTVTTTEKVTEEIVTAPEVEIRKTAELEAGKSKVVRPGQEGLKVMEYMVTKENGQVTNEEWLSQEVIHESVSEVVLQGTKIAGQGSGQFAWPVSAATISSTYGSRWGRQHKGIDMVSGNRTIMAADEGVITFTGTRSGYGNTVIINHSNGYTTLYGHMSSISVIQGQTVEKGSSIGVMGNTGRSTGTHLHFEILKNNVDQNPMKYLN